MSTRHVLSTRERKRLRRIAGRTHHQVAPNPYWLSIWRVSGMIITMKVTIDVAGRLVVPKAMRHALGIKPGQPRMALT